MATVNATVRRATNVVVGKGEVGNIKAPGPRTIELAPSASGTIVDFKLRIPADARIDPSSRLYNDNLTSSGSPTFQVGFRAVDANITTDPAALTTGVSISAASTAGAGAPIPKDFANGGKFAWELVSGQTVNPGGFFDVIGTVKAAATLTTTATITLDLKIYQD